MAAYGAAVSLKNTIQNLLQFRISLIPPSPHILQSAYDAMCCLQKVLRILDRTGYNKIRMKVNALDEQIKEVIWDFEDILESHVSGQILTQLESSRGERDHLSFSVDVRSLQRCADYLLERLTAMEVEYGVELEIMPEEEGELISSRIDFAGINSEMVGSSEEFERVWDYLLAEEEDVINWISVIGMAGVGKTTMAKKVFDDPSIQTHFELRAWVKVGRKCESNETLRCILAQLDPNIRHQMLTQGEGDDNFEKLVGVLEERLKNKKCLIVLDDVWEWDTRLMERLSQENVRILLTSRLRFDEKSPSFRRENYLIKLRSLLRDKGSPFQVVSLLNDEEGKKLLGEKVFGEKGFPTELDKLGEKIAKKCEGLPLMIVTIAELLAKEDKTPEFWTEVAEKQHNSVFEDAYDQISKVLFPSYEYLPQYLKMHFLYLGAFPPYSNIDAIKLFDLMKAEGFVEPIEANTFKDYTTECVEKLSDSYHLILYGANPRFRFSSNNFRVHSCWQHLCRKEASKTKFLHILQSCDDVVKDQRRLGAHCNTLFAFQKVYNSIKSDCASTVRSLLCHGPYHQYPVPIHAMDFKLLSVLDALNVRFYHVPLEILKLVCLKYLALTCNNELPGSISNLFHLQSLIIGQHTNIKTRGSHSYMPVEIWDMQELQHIGIYGRDLPTPNSDATLDKLTMVMGVSAKSCTSEILKRIPNLEDIVIRMELKPYDDDDDVDYCNTLSTLGNISVELQKLNRLVYVVRNPEMKYELMVPLQMFPSSLTFLRLSGLGCPWKHINDICSQLPNLTRLFLEEYAFRGPVWEIESGCFLKLERLVIEDADLVIWSAQQGSLPMLKLLRLGHCYKLLMIDWRRDPSMGQATIELVECNPLVLVPTSLLPAELFTVRYSFSFLDAT